MKAISFYNNNISPELVEYQKQVFSHFGIEIEQVCHALTHGEAIDLYLNNGDWENIAIFDIDCIPIHSDVLKTAKSFVDMNQVFAAAQQANHIKDSEIYASPAFVCFSKKVFESCGKPSFVATLCHDVGGYFSKKAKEMGLLHLVWPIHVEVPKWDLGPNSKFGYGTTYQGGVYHAFESRFNGEGASRFINKCKEVIGE